MFLLILGIVIFLGVHTVSTLRAQRADLIGKLGETRFKAIYSIGSLLGLVLIAYGFGTYRAGGYIPVWNPPFAMKYVAVPLTWIAFVCLAAAYAPVGKIKSTLKHPMLVGVKTWALAHLLANGDLGSIILFGSLLGWAVYDRISVKKRGDLGPAPTPFGRGDWIAIGAGTVVWLAIFAFHNALIGVRVLS
ncbi:MAG: NnrU family protein [Beijerinckiaceae bacterium]|nr:NnrU family protein [Beijerinckiaceae bacterium]